MLFQPDDEISVSRNVARSRVSLRHEVHDYTIWLSRDNKIWSSNYELVKRPRRSADEQLSVGPINVV